MSRISLTEYETSPQEVKEQYERQIEKNGKITHMKRTLLHSLPSYKAYMEWYVLRDEIVLFLGERTFLEGATPREIAERSAGNLLPVPWIEVEDVAEAVLYLCSNKSRYVTGTQLVLDAGLLTR
ncbi:SDR family oxidoreductase [Leptospira adleri]|uniref:SDR family oxidoreductase n=1 Tax=Leptospira adleri TaxID=2023186 RepID=A0A2M9YUL0_9LEPT|nr:SDR family oxidoreductase [Leptospira adleri]PJZ55224.1 hypothetical protein CH380_01575 [Leptospira adleri]PJZ63394.1 hypothetical protein CH376_02850 [Leptospira adleri]